MALDREDYGEMTEISKLDFFAAMAMQALLQKTYLQSLPASSADVAEDAYDIAREMVRESRRRAKA